MARNNLRNFRCDSRQEWSLTVATIGIFFREYIILTRIELVEYQRHLPPPLERETNITTTITTAINPRQTMAPRIVFIAPAKVV